MTTITTARSLKLRNGDRQAVHIVRNDDERRPNWRTHCGFDASEYETASTDLATYSADHATHCARCLKKVAS